METLYLTTSLFILLAGMAFQSGVTAEGSGSHTILTWAVALVLVACITLFLAVLVAEVFRSYRFATRLVDIRRSSVVGRQKAGDPLTGRRVALGASRIKDASTDVTVAWTSLVPGGRSGPACSTGPVSGRGKATPTGMSPRLVPPPPPPPPPGPPPLPPPTPDLEPPIPHRPQEELMGRPVPALSATVKEVNLTNQAWLVVPTGSTSSTWTTNPLKASRQELGRGEGAAQVQVAQPAGVASGTLRAPGEWQWRVLHGQCGHDSKPIAA
jgi:hypothetical protein